MKKKATAAKGKGLPRRSSVDAWNRAYRLAGTKGPEALKRFEAKLARTIGPLIDQAIKRELAKAAK